MSTPEDQLNLRTATKARIRRATRQAQEQLLVLDERAEQELLRIYRQASGDIEEQIRAAAGDGNLVREERLQGLRDQVRQRIDALSSERGELLDARLIEAARQGTEPWAGVVNADLVSISDRAVRFVHEFVDEEDGLQLSDRIWRLNRGARQAVQRRLEIAVVEGHSASRAAQDLLRNGESVPEDLQARIDGARADNIAPRAAGALVDDRQAYDNARRLFRTELGRAHNAAFESAAFEHPDTIGTRFNLSPRHPRRDICDLHASANRFGLGPGVYPRGKNPYPAHPNTFSFITPVFADEVTPEERDNTEEPVDWLQRQSADVQTAVLGGERKQRAFARGLIGKNEINTPWRVIRRRLEQRGVDISELEPSE